MDQGRDGRAQGRWVQDRRLGLVILAICAFLLYETFSFRVVAWDPLGLAFWPRVVLALLALVALWHVIRGSLDAGPFQPLQLRPFLILLGCTLYVLTIERLGWLIATPLFLVAFHLALGGLRKARLAEAVLFALLATTIVFHLFQGLVYVHFPEGLLEQPM
jgi:putative tricarboxylic transport membrane protein